MWLSSRDWSSDSQKIHGSVHGQTKEVRFVFCITVWHLTLQYLRVTVWQCDSVTVWQCDSVTVWKCESVKVWKCQSVTVWKCESVKVWKCDRVTEWQSDSRSLTPPLGSGLSSQSWWRKHVVVEDTEDLGEVWVNFAGVLCLGKDIGKLRVTGNPMELVKAILLALTDEVDAACRCVESCRVSRPFLVIWTVASLSIIRIAGICRGKTLSRCMPLFGANIKHIF